MDFGAAALVAAFFVIRALMRQHRAAIADRNRRYAEIAARADQQHNWVMQGDDRGIYGPQGAKLMHYVETGRSLPK